MIIEIVPIGFIEFKILEYLSQLLKKRFNTVAESRSGTPLDIFEKNAIRDQFESTKMLEELLKIKKPNENISLGVTDVDLSVPSLNFVFGEASPIGRVAVISITRLRPSFYGLQETDSVLLNRAGKEAIHELGHIFKLRHCSKPKCVMFFSNTLSDTDMKENDFCNKCEKSLKINLELAS
jgi:archaemetzincin